MRRYGVLASRMTPALIRALADSDVVVGGQPSVPAIWQQPHERALDVLDASVPTATLDAADVPGVQRGDTLVRRGTTYRVIGIEPDGQGLVRLRLELA